jgi:hypothetical protein
MRKKILFTLGCSFTEGDGAYPPEPCFESEGIPLDGSRREELHGTHIQNWYRNTYSDYFHENGWPAQLCKLLGYDTVINLGKCASSTSYQLKLLFEKYWDFDWENNDVVMMIYLTDSIRYSFYSGGVPQTFMAGDPNRPWTLSGRYAKIIQNGELDPLLEQLYHCKTLDSFCKARNIKLLMMNYWPREDGALKKMAPNLSWLDKDVWNPLPFEHGAGEPEVWDSKYHSPICYHPNKEGYRLMAENVYKRIQELHPDIIRNFKNPTPNIIWDGDVENCKYKIDDRILFDHEGLTDEEWKSYYENGTLPI